MNQEQLTNHEALLEHEIDPEVLTVNKVEEVHAESQEKLKRIMAGAPEKKKEKYKIMLSNVRAAALTLALLGNVGESKAHETPKEKLDAGPTLEQTAPSLLKALPQLSLEQTGTVTEMLSHELEKFMEGKKDSAHALTDTDATLGQKLDGGIDLIKTIPGLGAKLPGFTALERLRYIQQQLQNGASAKDVLVDLLGAVASSKTFGASDILRNYLQAYEENRIAKGLPDITYNPHTQVAP